MQALQPELSINLGAIRRNWQQLAERIRSANNGAACGAVVKANAYGLGIEPVGRILAEAGCETFYVATLAEGLTLREILPAPVNIVVFAGIQDGELDIFAEAQLTPVLSDPAQVRRWGHFCVRQGKPYASVLKLDTGMSRMGLTASEFTDLLAQPDQLRAASISMFMSHMACSEEPEHPLNKLQFERFVQARVLLQHIVPGVKATLANSSAIFLGADYHFDIARPGASLYGINPQPGQINPMQSVVRLRLPILRCREAEAGSSVGYGATCTIGEGGAQLAVVLGGYADGLFRSLSNRAQAICCGHRVPLLGRVSMDTCVFDVSAVIRNGLQPNFIELIGPELGVDALAEAAGTTGYEVLTNLGFRYRREYVNEWS